MKLEAGLPIALIPQFSSLSLLDMISSANSPISSAYMLANCSPLENLFIANTLESLVHHPQLSSNGQLEGAAYAVTIAQYALFFYCPFHS